MHTITPTSPDEALYLSLHALAEYHVYSESRNGPVLRFPGLVVTEWKNPMQRISWSPVRDANPFLHYIEAFWMLAGRNDVALVAKLAANMQNYSDDGATLFGAYGYRWRKHFGQDQILKIINELKRDPTSRRCVLQMWDGDIELDRALGGGRDVCCNHAITFDPCDGVLNMTVSNRSNDLVWGAYGANVVHMSILHEYVAAQTGLQLGTYFQCSSNLHLYLENPVTAKLVSYDPLAQERLVVNGLNFDINHAHKLQESIFLNQEMLSDPEMVPVLNTMLDSFLAGGQVGAGFEIRSLDILGNMCDAFNVYKNTGPKDAVAFLQNSSTSESYWVQNAVAWLMRRPSYMKETNAEQAT